MNPIVYLNGQFIALQEAKISVMDRGFLFGDGVYEVIPIFKGKLFKPNEHLQRLKHSLAAIEIPFSVDENTLIAIFKELQSRNTAPVIPHKQADAIANQAIYLQITRGAEEKRSHLFPENISPTVFIQCFPVKSKTLKEVHQGAKAITVEDIRWHACYIKSINLLPNLLVAEKAKKEGAGEAIFIRNNMAQEGSSSNLFIVKNQVILTPPADHDILSGITRNWILTLLKKHKMPYVEAPITKNMLMQADEVWMTGSIKEILPIIQIDGQKIGDGKIGPVCEKIIKLYEKSK